MGDFVARRTSYRHVTQRAYAVHIGVRALPLEPDTFAPNRKAMALNAVQLFQENDRWVVLIIEDGEETRRLFEIEQHAHSYAEGQRIRMRLPALGGHVPEMARTAAEQFRTDRLITLEGALTRPMETASPFPA